MAFIKRKKIEVINFNKVEIRGKFIDFEDSIYKDFVLTVSFYIGRSYNTVNFEIVAPILGSEEEESIMWFELKLDLIEKTENSYKFKIIEIDEDEGTKIKKPYENKTTIFSSMALLSKIIYDADLIQPYNDSLDYDEYYRIMVKEKLREYFPSIVDNFLRTRYIERTEWLNLSFYRTRRLAIKQNGMARLLEIFFYERDYILNSPEIRVEKIGKTFTIYYVDEEEKKFSLKNLLDKLI